MFMDMWTKHIKDDQEKGKFEVSVLQSKEVLERLSAMIDDFEKDLDATDLSPSLFDIPNWSHRQAFSNGYRSCMNDIRRLITLDQKKDK